jgi:hypothetical protein
MTDQELNRLEQLASKATPGHWIWRPTGGAQHAFPDGRYSSSNLRLCGHPTNLRVGAMDHIMKTDAELIAAARTAIPELITLVRELRAELDIVRRRDQSSAEALKLASKLLHSAPLGPHTRGDRA